MTTDASAESLYDSQFYQLLREGTERSAAAVVPVLIDLFRPESVVDVGCGAGLWLAAFRENGVDEVLGIDGSWVGNEQRAISSANFLEHDLSQPIRLDRRFDLALCLEVAEHLPAESAQALVESLTELSSVVVFSAAVPFQGGDGHVNERWPSYWSAFFDARGFARLDGLRQRIWDHDGVEVWYRQNIFCYVGRDKFDDYRHLTSGTGTIPEEPIDVVHPQLFVRRMNEFERRNRHAESLERDIEKLEKEKSHLEQDLAATRSELASISNSKVWRLYSTVRSLFKGSKQRSDSR